MSIHKDQSRGLSTREVAQHLQLTERQVHEILQSGRLRAEKTEDGRTVIRQSALREYQSQHQTELSGHAEVEHAQIDKAKIERAHL